MIDVFVRVISTTLLGFRIRRTDVNAGLIAVHQSQDHLSRPISTDTLTATKIKAPIWKNTSWLIVRALQQRHSQPRETPTG
jgi:hypothetical protein